jgi:16S rRNA (uracil1498-N3)-methyltransferase
MRISRVYINAKLTLHQEFSLDEKASHYVSKVLRLKIDAALIIFNGDNNLYHATINNIEKKSVAVTIASVETTNNESPLNIHLGIAVSKGDRFEWVIQKATELGVNTITPLISDRSEVKLKGERLQKKLQHWRQIAISSCEQNGRNMLPVISPLTPIDSWIESVEADKKWVLHHRSNQPLNAGELLSTAALLIGPEGGLSDNEITLAQYHEFNSLRLGPRVLRTETAPLVAITLLQHLWGDM